MKNVFKIKYIPTGFTFELAKERCDELLKNEPQNWEIEDKDYIFDKEEEKILLLMKKLSLTLNRLRINKIKLKNKGIFYAKHNFT